MARIGFTPRRTIAYLYVWTLMLAGLALALRFIPYSDHHGHFRIGWSLLLLALGLLVLAASVYLVYLLEILKFRRLATLRVRLSVPKASAGGDRTRRRDGISKRAKCRCGAPAGRAPATGSRSRPLATAADRSPAASRTSATRRTAPRRPSPSA